ncbi:MAG: phosphatase PAP2 family protein [Acidimicrobiia bacterium]
MTGTMGLDRTVLDWFVEHREQSLNTIMQVVTTLGGSAFLIPLVLAVGVWYWRRHGTARPLMLLAAAYGSSWFVSQSIKVLVGRARPPAGVALGHFSGYAFPSGHATEAAAVWGMLAVVLVAGAPRSQRNKVVGAAVTVVVMVGITRLYLAAHWLTDILAGWCFGSLCVLGVLAASQAITGHRGPPGGRGRIGQCDPSPSTRTGSPN